MDRPKYGRAHCARGMFYFDPNHGLFCPGSLSHFSKVLVQSSQHSSADPGDLMANTAGILGYGVPMNGLRNESLLDLVREQPNFDMIQSICIEDGRPSRYLTDLSIRFALCGKRLRDRVYHFYETNPSPDIIVSFQGFPLLCSIPRL